MANVRTGQSEGECKSERGVEGEREGESHSKLHGLGEHAREVGLILLFFGCQGKVWGGEGNLGALRRT